PPFPESWRDLTGQLVKIGVVLAFCLPIILILLLLCKEYLLHADIQITSVNGHPVHGDDLIPPLDASKPVLQLSGSSLVGSDIEVEYTLEGLSPPKDFI